MSAPSGTAEGTIRDASEPDRSLDGPVGRIGGVRVTRMFPGDGPPAGAFRQPTGEDRAHRGTASRGGVPGGGDVPS